VNKPARTCISCGKVTLELEQHVQDKHIGAPEMFQCRVCKKEWTTAGARNKHEFTHTRTECEAHGLVRLQ